MDSNESSESLSWTTCPEGMGNGLNIDPSTGLISDHLAPRIHYGGLTYKCTYESTGSDAASEADTPAIRRPRRKSSVVGLEELLVRREGYRAGGRKVVWITGCFDPLQAGHVRALESARQLGDVLVVGVAGDTERQPNGARAVVPAADRAEVVAALACVTNVLILDGTTPELVLERLRPDVRCKDAE